jgi:hypothetical protein
VNAALCWTCIDAFIEENPQHDCLKIYLQDRVRQGRCAFDETLRGKPTPIATKKTISVWEPRPWCRFLLEQTVLE